MTEEEVIGWLAGLFDENPAEFNTKLTRIDIPTWDSIGDLSLMAGFDEKFSIQITADDLQRMDSVADIIGYLREAGKLVTDK